MKCLVHHHRRRRRNDPQTETPRLMRPISQRLHEYDPPRHEDIMLPPLSGRSAARRPKTCSETSRMTRCNNRATTATSLSWPTRFSGGLSPKSGARISKIGVGLGQREVWQNRSTEDLQPRQRRLVTIKKSRRPISQRVVTPASNNHYKSHNKPRPSVFRSSCHVMLHVVASFSK